VECERRPVLAAPSVSRETQTIVCQRLRGSGDLLLYHAMFFSLSSKITFLGLK
jgi:hypothetical protein